MSSTPAPRKQVRLSYLTMAIVVKRMIRGTFTAADLRAASGLTTKTSGQLVRALLDQGVIVDCGFDPRTPGKPGPNIRRFEMVRL